jgi:hypothetical protein
VEAQNRGARVEAILDKSHRTDQYSAADFVASAGIPTRIDAAHGVAHHKLPIIDAETVIGGSKAAQKQNAEHELCIRCDPLAARSPATGKSSRGALSCMWGRVGKIKTPRLFRGWGSGDGPSQGTHGPRADASTAVGDLPLPDPGAADLYVSWGGADTAQRGEFDAVGEPSPYRSFQNPPSCQEGTRQMTEAGIGREQPFRADAALFPRRGPRAPNRVPVLRREAAPRQGPPSRFPWRCIA